MVVAHGAHLICIAALVAVTRRWFRRLKVRFAALQICAPTRAIVRQCFRPTGAVGGSRRDKSVRWLVVSRCGSQQCVRHLHLRVTAAIPTKPGLVVDVACGCPCSRVPSAQRVGALTAMC